MWLDQRLLLAGSRCFIAALSVAAISGEARAAAADPLEDVDHARLLSETPAADEAVRQGEAAVRSGDPARAAALFARARELAPRSPLPARRHCTVLAMLGRQQEALDACDKARMNGGSAADMRATVSAYLARPGAPTANELSRAMHYAGLSQQREPTLRYGAESRCDIARKIGDAHMLRACLADLQRLAPEHEETARMLASAAGGTPWRLWLGLAAIALLSLGTLAHALRRTIKLRPPRQKQAGPAPVVVALVLGAMLPAAAGRARAAEAPARPERAELSEYAIDDANPEASVPSQEKANSNPIQFGYLIQDLLDRADAATKRKDHAAAVRYYRAIVKAVPDKSVGLAKLCQAYEANGEIDTALKACGVALTKDGVTVDDHLRFARLMLGRPGALTKEEGGLLQSTISHLRRQPGGQARAEQLQCDLALKVGDGPMLEACASTLGKLAPDDPRTIGYQWALALQQRDRDQARLLLERARRAGVSAQGIAAMEALAAARPGVMGRWGLPLMLVLLAACLVAAVVLGRGVLKRRAIARAAQATGG
jgi:tetratricopeptide (TPR) repeat protein